MVVCCACVNSSADIARSAHFAAGRMLLAARQFLSFASFFAAMHEIGSAVGINFVRVCFAAGQTFWG